MDIHTGSQMVPTTVMTGSIFYPLVCCIPNTQQQMVYVIIICVPNMEGGVLLSMNVQNLKEGILYLNFVDNGVYISIHENINVSIRPLPGVYFFAERLLHNFQLARSGTTIVVGVFHPAHCSPQLRGISPLRHMQPFLAQTVMERMRKNELIMFQRLDSVNKGNITPGLQLFYLAASRECNSTKLILKSEEQKKKPQFYRKYFASN